MLYNYGSINIDHVYRVPHLVQPGETLASQSYQQVLGGKGANQSIALARAGADVRHIGRYHSADRALLEPLFSAGVDGRHLQAVDMPGGHAIIQVDDAAENAIILFAGANHSFNVEEFPVLLAEAMAGDWLLLQNECSGTAEMMTLAASKGLQVAFNPAPMEASVALLPLEQLAVLFVNEVEVLQLLGADSGQGSEQDFGEDWLASQLQQRLPETRVIVTLGAKGAYCFYRGAAERVPAWPVKAVDTTGAGDTFIGYFMQALLSGQSVRTALERACQASALCVQRVGASSSIPTAREVDAFEKEFSV